MSQVLDAAVLDQLFREARTFSYFDDRQIDDETLKSLYDVLKFGPTSANSSPARFVFVRSPESKEKLKPALSEGNRDKTMAAPVTVIVAYDLAFYDELPALFPQADARSWFAGNDAVIQATCLRNGSLQGAYLMLAARAFGLDCGPMSGFDNAVVDAAFFEGTNWRSNFLINLGYGVREKLHPRNPRLPFETACRIV
ncbi:putative NADH dehydrogenase/NAD(P)H nitroreductase [Jeongeupia sp. HS-3]|uniref:malonic semialdehyde reductase n=1 Tax=Jeongeupia sp. HS-3 TaxID=1009682 RepID=UPI0018A40624|nr:malonic semialdehyde reductase [Jeongeupia sp. HS-3]BCL76149.1 putative NADH dehydrogenase/NAD(P)H nitroreductase [Jeongeupia sp. HS-3]